MTSNLHRLPTLLLAVAFVLIVLPSNPVAAESVRGLQRERYFSEFLGREREYWLYLPKGYHEAPNRRWPVLMFLHGGGERGDHLELVLRHGPIKEVVT